MKIQVNSGSLKNTFKIISSLMRNTELTKSICFTTEDDKLFITFRAGVIYQTELKLISSQDYVNTTITVRYSNLEKLLSGMQTTEIVFSSFGIEIENPGITAVMLLSDSVITKFDIPELQYSDFEFQNFKSSMDKLSKTSALDKIYQKQFPFYCFEQYCGKRYPLIFLRASGTKLRGIYPPDMVKTIQLFAPTDYTEYQGSYYFKHNNATLIMQTNKVSEDTIFTDKFSDMEEIASFDVKNLTRLLDILSMCKGTQVKCYIGTTGMDIGVRTSYMEISPKVKNHVVSFEIISELLHSILTLIDDDYVIVLRKEDLLCFKTPSIDILTLLLN